LDPGQSYCHLFSKPETNFRRTVQDMKVQDVILNLI
jgi:hypothetical protein